jgi:hypothetical protein
MGSIAAPFSTCSNSCSALDLVIMAPFAKLFKRLSHTGKSQLPFTGTPPHLKEGESFTAAPPTKSGVASTVLPLRVKKAVRENRSGISSVREFTFN